MPSCLMSLADLKQESAALSPEEQKELAAFLAVLRMQQSGEWEDAAAGVEETDSESWMTLEDAKRRLEREA